MSQKVAVLLGGISNERKISLLSGQAVLEGLKNIGITAFAFDTKYNSILHLKKLGFNKAFIALHGQYGEDGRVQAILEYLNIPYTGSGVVASAIGMDKLRTKLIWQSLGLPITPYLSIHKSDINKLTKVIKKYIDILGLPLIVKPNNEGSSIGVTLVRNRLNLIDAIRKAFLFSHEILLESFISGFELSIGILDNKLLPPVHIQPKGEYYNYEEKYSYDRVERLHPAKLDFLCEKELNNIVLQAWRALGCYSWGRVDLVVGNDNKFYLLEINTVPGLTNNSLITKAASYIGIDFSQLIGTILKLTH